MIIGIAGKKLHGKDTTANILIKQFGYKKVSLADPLKKILAIGLKEFFTLEEFYDQSIKDLPFDKWTSFPEIVLTRPQIERITCAINLNYNLSATEMAIIKEWFTDEKFYSLRDLMQRFGTDLMRNLINNNIWVDTLQKQINHNLLNNPDQHFITCDIRYPNERKMIKNLNGLLILVKRNIESKDSHISEQSLGNDNEYNVVIENYGSLDDLDEKVVRMHQFRYPFFK